MTGLDEAKATPHEADPNSYWYAVSADEPFAQGDLLRGAPADGSAAPAFGLVITADCDIVQAKAADRLTYVDVVSTRTYLESVWIPDQLQKFLKKQAPIAAEGMAAVMRRSELSFGLNEAQLLTWLRERPLDVIVAAVNRTGKPFDKNLMQKLNALRCALGAESYADPVAQWRQLRSILGETEEKQRADLAYALTGGGGGFPDFFLLPDLPGADGLGYVALLRFMRTVHATEVFTNEVDARIDDRPAALHRVGRLTDDIRFAVTQKLAFLFSRIGLPSHFEASCRSAATLAAEGLYLGEL